MATCASVRKKGSLDKCGSRPLVGHTLCGIHARSKTVTLWAVVNADKVTAATRIQAWMRGVLLRRRLLLAGPGVLSRKDAANTEDLDTCEVSDPLSYFGFREGDKLWWFDFATLWKWAQTSVEPTNPYTRVPLDTETRKRLHQLWAVRRRRREPVPADPSPFADRLRARWTVICQVFAEHGLGTIEPDVFLDLTKNDYIVLFRILRDDLRASLPLSHALSLIHRCLITSWTLPPGQFILQGSYALLTMLLHAKDPYPLSFYILSALYRI